MPLTNSYSPSSDTSVLDRSRNLNFDLWHCRGGMNAADRYLAANSRYFQVQSPQFDVEVKAVIRRIAAKLRNSNFNTWRFSGDMNATGRYLVANMRYFPV